MDLYVGTSGWAYKEWKPDFYPADLPQKRFLEHYAGALGACEINATFYRLQSPEAVGRWAEVSPAGFRFSTKAHRRLTHMRAWPVDERGRAFLDAYLKTVTALGDRLGVVLWQFPDYKRRDDEGLAGLVEILPRDLSYAFEFRDESWETPEIHDAVAALGGTVCVSNTDGTVPEELPPGPLAYVRMRTERYSPEARAGWLELLQREAQTRPVFAFVKHEGIPAADPYGGIGLARWLTAESRK
ncbi:MAG: DUF72 domain-containing protein [Actinomycetota bacterium]